MIELKTKEAIINTDAKTIHTSLEMDADTFYRFLMGSGLMLDFVRHQFENNWYNISGYLDNHNGDLRAWLFGED